MKHMITALLILLAVVVGLLMPELWLEAREPSLEKVQTIELSEAVLQWDNWESPEEEIKGTVKELTAKDLMHQLKLFASTPDVSIPQSLGNTVDTTWVIDRGVHFLNDFFEVGTDISGVAVDYRLAWFAENVTSPIWSMEMTFDGGRKCFFDISAETGVILRCMIFSNGTSFADLFPDSFLQGESDALGPIFRELIRERFCQAYQSSMSHYEGIKVSVWPTEEQGAINITMTDNGTEHLTVPLYIEPIEGIWFNYP